MLKKLLRKVAWHIIVKTNDFDMPHYGIFTHKECGSQSVIPLGKFFSSWKEPAFECLDCGCLTNADIECHLIDPQEVKKPSDGSVVLHPLY